MKHLAYADVQFVSTDVAAHHVAAHAWCSTCGWEWWSDKERVWTNEDSTITRAVLLREAEDLVKNHVLAFQLLDKALGDVEYYKSVIPGLDTFLPGSPKRPL